MTELENFFTTLNFKGLNPDRDYVMTKARPPERIFLCGGNQKDNFRTKLHSYLEDRGHNLLKIENVLNWYAAQNFNNDLLELEKYFAALVSIIPIVSESIGSAAELGAFVNDVHIREKVYILIKKEHYSGKGSQSFIRYGPIKSYEKHVSKDGSGIYEIDDVEPEKDIENIAESIIKHQSKQVQCDFNYGYFQVLLLADIINALVVCDRKEIKSHFKYAISCAFPVETESDSVYKNFENRLEEMLFVLEHLEIIKIKSTGKKYYIARHRDWFLDYRAKNPKEYKKITEVKKEIMNEIYSNDTIKTSILKEEKKKGDIEWLRKFDLLKLPIQSREELIRKAPLLYKVYEIPKKSGGTRTIAQPTPKLKQLQRETILELEERIFIHSCATAYIKNKNGILENAQAHKDSKFFFKYDFKDFFPSIKAADFNKHLEKVGYSESERIDLLKIIFRFKKEKSKKKTQEIYTALRDTDFNQNTNPDLLKLMIEDYKDEFQLSIGAPSSPFVSNAIMFDFDESVSKWAEKHDFIYTRFADDITISSQKKQDQKIITTALNETLKDLEYPKLQLNDSKQKYVSLKSRVTITGLNITSEHKVSLGREKKKQIRAMIHHYVEGKFPKHEINELSGWLAYANAVDSEFFKSMQTKYGEKCIASIMKKPK